MISTGDPPLTCSCYCMLTAFTLCTIYVNSLYMFYNILYFANKEKCYIYFVILSVCAWYGIVNHRHILLIYGKVIKQNVEHVSTPQSAQIYTFQTKSHTVYINKFGQKRQNFRSSWVNDFHNCSIVNWHFIYICILFKQLFCQAVNVETTSNWLKRQILP